ncbi:hypothetical protein D1BOALGB6SA_7758 [Olavius sp. associated proteobacterium Delta 1]|nr:hypothetical protein D1BOALGB6SA_7758 [Olavius sp. associated proteobacterium Delta 1]
MAYSPFGSLIIIRTPMAKHVKRCVCKNNDLCRCVLNFIIASFYKSPVDEK